MKPKSKAVFDTNIYISALIFGGNPRTSLELARSGEIELISSRSILLELAEKLRGKFLWVEKDIQEAIKGILVFTKLVTPSVSVAVIKNDPADNRILECALESKANYIVSGDKKHLLSLKKFKGIPILSAKSFLDEIYEKN